MCETCDEVRDSLRSIQEEMVRVSSIANDSLVVTEANGLKVERLLREQHVENEKQHDEMFTRLRNVEIKQARNEGVKSGVIGSVSLLWTIAIAAVAGIWGLMKP